MELSLIHISEKIWRLGNRRVRRRHDAGAASRSLRGQGARENDCWTNRKTVLAEHEQRVARCDADVIPECRPLHALAIHPGAILRIQVLDQEAVTLAPNHEMPPRERVITDGDVGRLDVYKRQVSMLLERIR